MYGWDGGAPDGEKVEQVNRRLIAYSGDGEKNFKKNWIWFVCWFGGFIGRWVWVNIGFVDNGFMWCLMGVGFGYVVVFVMGRYFAY